MESIVVNVNYCLYLYNMTDFVIGLLYNKYKYRVQAGTFFPD